MIRKNWSSLNLSCAMAKTCLAWKKRWLLACWTGPRFCGCALRHEERAERERGRGREREREIERERESCFCSADSDSESAGGGIMKKEWEGGKGEEEGEEALLIILSPSSSPQRRKGYSSLPFDTGCDEHCLCNRPINFRMD